MAISEIGALLNELEESVERILENGIDTVRSVRSLQSALRLAIEAATPILESENRIYSVRAEQIIRWCVNALSD